MRNNLLRLIIAGSLVVSTACATEIRTPWISSRGPLRYTFDKLYPENKRNINVWKAVHFKEGHKAFLKHGTKTKELSALIFNKQDFKLIEIFPDSDVPLTSENFNPFMATTSISPRVAYTEYGITMGGRVDWPVWENKGRIGLRATVPFRRIEMERKDSELDEAEDPLANLVVSKQIKIVTKHDGTAAAAATSDAVVKAYRLDLVQRLPNTDGTPILVGTNGAGVTIFGTQIGVNVANKLLASTGLASADDVVTNRPFVHAFMLGDGGGGVRNTSVANSVFQAANIETQNPDFSTAAGLPDKATPQITVFNSAAGDYSTSFVGAGNQGFQENAEKLWLIFRRQSNSPDPEYFGAGDANNAGLGGGVARGIDNLLQQYEENIFTFFNKNKFSFDDQIRSGMGDIDVDLFYEHMFSDEWSGELALGVRLPTGGDKDQYGNPYKAILGNGEHWEIKLAGLMAWQPCHWVNIKADMSYNFVLENTEHRVAAFKGAQIKNIGPRADADVDWGYFLGHVDFTFFHPKTQDIRSTIGYELYYKTRDHVSFKKDKMQSWLGGTVTGGGVVLNEKPLDSKLAEKNTESVAHKIRSETSFQVNPYFELFAGASATFAGQNIMRDRDLHGGCNIRF